MTSSEEQYLNENLRSIFTPLIDYLLVEEPSDPVISMIEYFRKLKGIKSEFNSEKEELINLRKEIEKFKKSHVEDDEMVVHSAASSEDEEENPEEVAKLEAMIQNKKISQKQRQSVSAEAYGIFNKKVEFVPKKIEKTKEQDERIKNKVMQSFLFNSLEDHDLRTVIDAMEERKFSEGEYVIKQGDNGDVLYLVDVGELDCYKTFKKEDGDVYLKTYYPGEAFGELALLYNAPRQASIKSKFNSVLFSLDRETFNHIVKDAAIKKREKYVNFLKNIEILKSIDPYELNQISDALTVKKVSKGENVINQNEIGDSFYIVEQGHCTAWKVFKEGEEPQNVLEYKEGGYFGELAILRNEPRAASVKANTDCRLLVLDRKSFKRLLGPVEDILKRNSEQYLKYMKK